MTSLWVRLKGNAWLRWDVIAEAVKKEIAKTPAARWESAAVLEGLIQLRAEHLPARHYAFPTSLSFNAQHLTGPSDRAALSKDDTCM